MACTVPMRVVIGVLVASIVLLVAIITLVITYSVAITSLRDIAEQLTVSLVQGATIKTETYFGVANTHLLVIQDIARQPGFMLPVDDHVTEWSAKWFTSMLPLILSVNNSYGGSGIIFDDGSAVSGNILDSPLNRELLLWGTTVKDRPAGGFNRETFLHRYLDNMTGDPNPTRSLIPGAVGRIDSRFPAYFSAVSLWPGSQGFYFPMVAWTPGNQINVLLPAVIQLRNASGHFLGLGTLSRDVREVSSFLSEVVSGDTHAFALDSNQRVIASTHPSPYFEQVTTSSTIVPPGCASSASTSTTGVGPFSMACFKRATEFPYAPLQKVGGQKGFASTDGQAVELISTDSDGTYYVVSSNVASSFRSFKINLVLVMPEELIIGDIVRGRNIAILSTAGLFLLASIAAFFLVYLLLMPLSSISEKMQQTASLKDIQDDESEQLSRLTEVRTLQKSFYNMNAAIQSFTRYVPRDVVTDLMNSGQLCEIKMEETRCSVLFVDIQGFTTICERVPVEQLSELVSLYFDVMSTIVMKHDGLIDKYIGDCIMAVWGAPFPCSNHEIKASLTALLLHRETLVPPLSTSFDEAGEMLGVRVGVNTGMCLAGNMGSTQRMNYTVIGDPVNLAARLESMNKQFGTHVMISEETALAVGGVFLLRLLLSIAVVGKHVPVKVYEVAALNKLSNKDMDMINETDAAFRSVNDQSDTSTMLSASGGSHTQAHAMSKIRRARSLIGTVSLIQAALSGAFPPTPTAADIVFCERFTEAVNHYYQKRFGDALSALSKLNASFGSDFIGEASTRSALGVEEQLLRDASEDSPSMNAPVTLSDSPDTLSLQSINDRSERPVTLDGSMMSPSAIRKNVRGELSVRILTDMCEKALEDPDAFQGYFVSTEK